MPSRTALFLRSRGAAKRPSFDEFGAGVNAFNVVLVHPDQPGNTGNVGRTCLALGCRLHLVGPYGFKITDRDLKRAGMDYWPQVDLVEHASLAAWMGTLGTEAEVFLFSTRGKVALPEVELKPGSHLVFGSESAGLPPSVWERFGERSVRIPMREDARSLNLATSVGIVLGAASFRTCGRST
jgi:tRNA (cytidine/uridine-2'-O-)-methyltransferase